MERSVVERLAKIKAIVISYELWMSYKKEEICSLMANYFTVPDRNNSHIVMPYITDTDDVSLSKYVMEVVDNFGLEENIVGIISDDGDNIHVYGRHWSQNTAMTPFSTTQSRLQQ